MKPCARLAVVDGANLRALRRQHKLRQVELAAGLGVSQARISRWESGRDPLAEQTFRIIRLALERRRRK